MRFIPIIIFFLFVSVPTIGQKGLIEFKSEKDTVFHGQTYRNSVTAKVASGDSILLYEVYIGNYKIPLEGNTAMVGFTAFRNSADEPIVQKEQELQIKLRTLKFDTLIIYKMKYFVRPYCAYVHQISDYNFIDVKLFPDTPPVLISHPNGIKDLIRSTLLKGQEGELEFSFFIDVNGATRSIKICKNTFTSLTEQKLLEFLNGTKWSTAKNKSKVVKTIVNVDIKL